MLPDSRRCTKCGVVKPLSQFSKAPRGKWGVKANCKACDAARPRKPSPRQSEDIRRARYTSHHGDTKVCTRCGEEKPLSEFSKSRDGKYRPSVRGSCKECNSAAALEWWRNNKDRAAYSRRNRDLAQYGLTAAEYDSLLAGQHGVCAICGEDEPSANGRTGRKFRLSVDHCHDTGRVRGLLCHKCNRAIGLLNDDPALLKRAAEYLQKGRESD